MPSSISSQPTIAEQNAVFLTYMKKIANATWAGAVALGIVAAALINGLVTAKSGSPAENLMALGLKADLALFGALFFGALGVAFVMAAQDTWNNEVKQRFKLLSMVAFLAGFLAFCIALVCVQATSDLWPTVWDLLGRLAKASPTK